MTTRLLVSVAEEIVEAREDSGSEYTEQKPRLWYFLNGDGGGAAVLFRLPARWWCDDGCGRSGPRVMDGQRNRQANIGDPRLVLKTTKLVTRSGSPGNVQQDSLTH